jgi:hypothetical protein
MRRLGADLVMLRLRGGSLWPSEVNHDLQGADIINSEVNGLNGAARGARTPDPVITNNAPDEVRLTFSGSLS